VSAVATPGLDGVDELSSADEGCDAAAADDGCDWALSTPVWCGAAVDVPAGAAAPFSESGQSVVGEVELPFALSALADVVPLETELPVSDPCGAAPTGSVTFTCVVPLPPEFEVEPHWQPEEAPPFAAAAEAATRAATTASPI
jgi:hypothetical protein